MSEKKKYTEEDVIAIIHQAFYDIGYHIDVITYPDGTTMEVEGVEKWFEKMKKEEWFKKWRDKK